jgi:hypothetical protein
MATACCNREEQRDVLRSTPIARCSAHTARTNETIKGTALSGLLIPHRADAHLIAPTTSRYL